MLIGEGHREAKQKWHHQQKAGIKKVIGISKLKTKYEAPEAKRQLASSFDLFLADERIIPSLPKLIGNLNAQCVPVTASSYLLYSLKSHAPKERRIPFLKGKHGTLEA